MALSAHPGPTPKVDAGQHAHAVLVRAALDDVERARKAITRQVVGADHHPDVQGVERRHQRVQAIERAQKLARMPVKVDGWELGLRNQMLTARRAWTWADSRRSTAAETPAPGIAPAEPRSCRPDILPRAGSARRRPGRRAPVVRLPARCWRVAATAAVQRARRRALHREEAPRWNE